MPIYLTLVLQPMCIDFMFQKITTSHALSSQPEYQQVIDYNNVVNVDIRMLHLSRGKDLLPQTLRIPKKNRKQHAAFASNPLTIATSD